MNPANPTERFLREPGDRGSIRVELWAADFLRPETFNAVIFGTGRVEVQSIEYQIEHRFLFQISERELGDLFAAIAAADLLSCPPEAARESDEPEHRHPPPARIVLVNAAGERREFSFRDDPPGAFELCHRAVVDAADPFRRGIEPCWSRGPYIGAHPFPESAKEDGS